MDHREQTFISLRGNANVARAPARRLHTHPRLHRPAPVGNRALNNLLLSRNPSTGAIVLSGKEGLLEGDHDVVSDRLAAAATNLEGRARKGRVDARWYALTSLSP